MIDTKKDNENYQLTINFNPRAMDLLMDCQKNYELLFNKHISYEEILLMAFFQVLGGLKNENYFKTWK